MSEQVSIVRSESVPVDSITTHPENANRGNVAAIARGLSEHGQYRRIVVHEETRQILAGNTTYLAARDKLGWTHIEVDFVRCTPEKARAILAWDNRARDLGEYDDAALLALLEQIEDDGNLLAAGFDDEDLDDLRAKLEEGDDLPDVNEANIKLDFKGIDARKEDAASYELSGTRTVVLSYPNAEYVWLVDSLKECADLFGVESNSDAVLIAVGHVLGTTPSGR